MVFLTVLLIGVAADPDSVGEKVVEFARSKLGEKVGDGECTTLARDALRHAGVKRRRRASWGEERASVKDAQPGDILQFEQAVFVRRQVRDDGALVTRTYAYPHHTAIVSGVKKRGRNVLFTVLHQNAGAEGGDDAERKVVQEWTINLAEMRSGTVKAYRPTGG